MSLGYTYHSALNADGNAHYTSERIVQELVGTLTQRIEEIQLAALSQSLYGLLLYESTDISVTKQLVLYGRYDTDAGESHSTFLDLADGIAECNEEAIKAYNMAEKDLAFSKPMGFGSDGASVMSGRLSGVVTRQHRSISVPRCCPLCCSSPGFGLLAGR